MNDASCILTDRDRRSFSNINTLPTIGLPQQQQHNPHNVTYYNHPNGSNFTGVHFAPAPVAHGQVWHAYNTSGLMGGGAVGGGGIGDGDEDDLGFIDYDEDGNLLVTDSPRNASSSSGTAQDRTAAPSVLDKVDIRDYLVGWNRYCKMLRCVQFSRGRVWERKFEGDRWLERRG